MPYLEFSSQINVTAFFFPPLNKWQFNTLIQHLSKINAFFGKFHCIEISISMNSIWIINEWKKISNRCFIDANCFGATGNTLTYFHFNTNQDMSIGTFFPFAMEKNDKIRITMKWLMIIDGAMIWIHLKMRFNTGVEKSFYAFEQCHKVVQRAIMILNRCSGLRWSMWLYVGRKLFVCAFQMKIIDSILNTNCGSCIHL